MSGWRIRMMTVLALAAMWTVPALARGQLSDRPVTLLVAFDQGGSTDVLARQLAPYLARHLGPGARVEVVNRPGASGELGFAAIADAAPDGYTIGFINTPNVVAIPIERSARYTLDRLDPLVNVVDDPGVWTVAADSPFASVADVVAAARNRPGTIAISTTGVGSDDHLAVLLMQSLSGAEFLHRPFPGSAAAYRALQTGRVQVCGQNVAEGLRARQTDPIRVLGVMAPRRLPIAPDIPTFAEQGYDVVLSSQRGVAAPRGLSPAIRSLLVAALKAALADPAFVAETGSPETYQSLRVLGPDAFAAALRAQDRQLRSLWQRSPWVNY